MRYSLLIILSLCPCLSYRAKPNSKDILPKGISFPETELPEGKLCKVASPKLPKTLPYFWRQVFNPPHLEILSVHHQLIRFGKLPAAAAGGHIWNFTAFLFISKIMRRLVTHAYLLPIYPKSTSRLQRYIEHKASTLQI